MRLPNKKDDATKIHFLTDFYISKFKLPLADFKNADDDAFLKFYNMNAMTYRGMYWKVCVIILHSQL